MPNFPEVGYTPTNLRHLIETNNLTQANAAAICLVDDSTVRRWLMPLGTSSRRDMPHETWTDLLEVIEKGVTT